MTAITTFPPPGRGRPRVPMPPGELFIEGRLQPREHRRAVVNPATGTQITTVAGASACDVELTHDENIRVFESVEPEHNSVNSGGYFIRPTVLADVPQSSPFIQDEIFGPVLTVQPFDTDADAVQLAHGTPYELAAGLQTTDVSRAHRLAHDLQTGVVPKNDWGVINTAMPVGGYESSGYGRENGPEGLDDYLQTKSVLITSRARRRDENRHRTVNLPGLRGVRTICACNFSTRR